MCNMDSDRTHEAGLLKKQTRTIFRRLSEITNKFRTIAIVQTHEHAREYERNPRPEIPANIRNQRSYGVAVPCSEDKGACRKGGL